MVKSDALFARIAPLDAESGVPRHLQIRNALRAVIDRHFSDGEKFFTETELGARLRVSQGTLRRALLDLSREGLLERRVAKGSFVRKHQGSGDERASDQISVFVPSLASSFWADLLETLAQACRAEGQRLDIRHTNRGEQLAASGRVIDQSTSGQRAILLGDDRTVGGLYRALRRQGWRTVVVDAVIPGHRAASVRVDNAAGINLGIAHLAGLGHRRIALIVNEPRAEGSVAERVAAYGAAMRARGLKGTVVDCGTRLGERSFDRATAVMERVWALAPRPTALFCVSDPGAWAALKWCAQRGIVVPDELSILGFDDDRPSRYTFPALSSVAQPLAKIAAAAIRALDPRSPAARQVILPPTLAIRESTTRAPRATIR